MKKMPICKFPTTVMLVDDDPLFLASVKMLVPRDLFRPITYTSAKEALKKLSALKNSTGERNLGTHKVEFEDGKFAYHLNDSFVLEGSTLESIINNLRALPRLCSLTL